MDPISSILNIGGKIIDKIFPDKDQAEKAKIELLKLSQKGELKQLEIEMQVLLAEAKSKDKFVSRARPAFLYVMYALLLSAIPMGFLSAYDVAAAKAIAQGLRDWLAAFPSQFWVLFGVGYTGYTVNREYGKAKLLNTLSQTRN